MRLGSDEVGQLRRQLLQRQHEIRAAGDRAARHRGVFGFIGVLHQDEPARLAHGPHADGPVRTAAAEYDGEAVSVLGGQRPEELVDRRALPARLVETRGLDESVGDEQPPVGRDHVDGVGLKLLAMIDLHDAHMRGLGQHRSQFARMVGIEMQDDNERHAELLR